MDLIMQQQKTVVAPESPVKPPQHANDPETVARGRAAKEARREAKVLGWTRGEYRDVLGLVHYFFTLFAHPKQRTCHCSIIVVCRCYQHTTYNLPL